MERAALGITLALFACAPVLARNAPDDPAAVVDRARTMIFGGEPAAALELLRPLAERQPGNTAAHFFRGMAAVAAARPAGDRPGAPDADGARRALLDEAVESYRHILESRPGLATVRQKLAEALFWRGEPAAALELLRPLAERRPGNTDAHFFRGMAAAATANLPEGRPGAPPDADGARRALLDEAVESYRHILESRPGLAGARLELGRVLFRRGRCMAPPESLLKHLLGDDCDAAAHHFRRALAGGLPDGIAEQVSYFIAVVQARKRVSGSFELAIAPDSNVNAGTSARTVATRFYNPLTGESLKFDLGEDTRGTSGVGVIISASGEYLHPAGFRLFEGSMTRLRLGGGLYRREYGGRRFDDMTLSVHAGPQFLLPKGKGQVSLLVKADRRWDGVKVEADRWSEKPVSRSLGPRIEGGWRLGERLSLGGSLERVELRNRGSRANDGPRTALDLNLAFTATPAITFGVRGGWQRSMAERPELRGRTRRIGSFAAADLPPVLGVTGFRTAFHHDVLLTRYDEPGYFFITPEARRDRTSISRLSVSNDHIELFRFVPALSLVHERSETNIDRVFDYQRNRAEITMRRTF